MKGVFAKMSCYFCLHDSYKKHEVVKQKHKQKLILTAAVISKSHAKKSVNRDFGYNRTEVQF
jgi:hypothetical protein